MGSDKTMLWPSIKQTGKQSVTTHLLWCSASVESDGRVGDVNFKHFDLTERSCHDLEPSFTAGKGNSHAEHLSLTVSGYGWLPTVTGEKLYIRGRRHQVAGLGTFFIRLTSAERQ